MFTTGRFKSSANAFISKLKSAQSRKLCLRQWSPIPEESTFPVKAFTYFKCPIVLTRRGGDNLYT